MHSPRRPRRGPLEQREVVQRDRVFDVRRGHERGHDPGQRERERAQRGDPQGPGGGRPAVISASRVRVGGR